MSDLSSLTPGVWNIDVKHSSVGFVARHLMISKVRGRFTDFAGSITVGTDPLQSKVEATVQMASVSTGDDGRDTHLRTNDFFAIEQHPTMAFTSTGLSAGSGGGYVLNGGLTIKGVTLPVSFALEFEGVNKDPWGGTRVAFEASAEINRKDFGVEYNAVLETGGVMIGEKVQIALDIQAVRA